MDPAGRSAGGGVPTGISLSEGHGPDRGLRDAVKGEENGERKGKRKGGIGPTNADPPLFTARGFPLFRRCRS